MKTHKFFSYIPNSTKKFALIWLELQIHRILRFVFANLDKHNKSPNLRKAGIHDHT